MSSYLVHALWQYTIHRLKKHVLIVGVKDEAFERSLKREGAVVRFVGEADLTALHALRNERFDTVIFLRLSEVLADLSGMVETGLRLVDKVGNLLILDRPEEQYERFVALKEDDAEDRLYVINHFLTRDTVDQYKVRLKMIKELQGPPKYSLGLFGKQVFREDLQELALTMLRAYYGTIDYQNESLEDTRAELEKVFAGEYGPFLSAASLCYKKDGEIVSAVLVNLYQELPLISYVFTDPDYQGSGFARKLLTESFEILSAEGYKQVTLAVSLKNTKAMKLYRKLGFLEAGRSIV